LLFRIYFHLGQESLCNNILKALAASDIPDIDRFPKSQAVKYYYYVGLLQFFQERYDAAECSLLKSYLGCHSKALKNKQLILEYLIPLFLLKSR
jgi:hypothetical protein